VTRDRDADGWSLARPEGRDDLVGNADAGGGLAALLDGRAKSDVLPFLVTGS
jgi:hypothetical protein